MEKIVRKYSSFEEADTAEYEYYRSLSGEQRIELLLEMILPDNSDEAIIQRSARVYPIAELE